MKNGHANDLAGKNILLINTGSLRKRFILQKIKKLGVNLYVVNKEKNWASPYVDHWILANNADHGEVLAKVEDFLEQSGVRIDGALTFWEDDVLLLSKIVEKFRFKGIRYAAAKQVRNKFLFRDFCANNNLPSTRYKIVGSSDDLNDIGEDIKFPVVLKPAYGTSSAFVVKADNEEELKESFVYIKNSFSTTVESALADGADILIEEYLDGDEVDLDIIVQNGKIKFCSITDNERTKEPFFIEGAKNTPSNLSYTIQKELEDMADEVLEKLKIRNGCVHFEAKSTARGPVPIEVNLRMGGDETYFLVRGAWGFDLIENALKTACGTYVKKYELPSKPFNYMAADNFLSDYSGVLSMLDIKKELERAPYIVDFQFQGKIGEPVLVPPEGYDYLGWVVVKGKSFPDAEAKLETAKKMVSYEVARFRPTSFIGKTGRSNRFAASRLKKAVIVRGSKIEKIKRFAIKDLRKLKIGIACNLYNIKDGSMAVEEDLMSIGLNIQKTLNDRGYAVQFFDFNNLPEAFEQLRVSDVDLVFNVCERINNSSLLEPHSAAILDALQIPYTGSNPFTLGLCIDKIRVKKLLAFHNMPTPRWDYAYSMDDSIREDLRYPLIIKPANTDNSIGITNDSVVANEKEFEAQLERVIKEYHRPALIEEYIEGDEYDVSIIGSDENDLRILPLSRSIFDKMPEGLWHIYPFESKFGETDVYKKGITVQRPPKNIGNKLSSLISEIAVDTYNILDCHDYGRVEIRVDKNNNPYVLELNPNPSINIGDCVPKVAELAGMDYGDFLEEVIRMAIWRYKNNPPYYHLQAGFC